MLLLHDVLMGILLLVSEETPDGVERAIRALEESLANAEWVQARISWLLQRKPDSLGAYDAGDFKLSKQQLQAIARKGLVQSWKDGDLTTEKIGELADDPATLQGLNDALLEALAESKLAPCWEHAFDLSSDYPEIHVDLEKIYLEEKKRQEKKGG